MIIILAGVGAAVLVAAWLNRRALGRARRHFAKRMHQPVILTRGSLGILMLLVGLGLATTIITSAVNRHEVSKEREARLDVVTAQLTDRGDLMRLKREVEAYAKQQARLARPTARQRLQDVLRGIRVCASSGTCKTNLAPLLRTVIRIVPQTGEIVPAPSRGGPPAPKPKPAPSSPPAVAPAPIVRPDPQVSVLARQVEQLEHRVAVLSERHPVDSTALNVVDQRVRDLEQVVGGLDQRVGSLVSGLCRSALGRLLTGLGLCG